MGQPEINKVPYDQNSFNFSPISDPRTKLNENGSLRSPAQRITFQGLLLKF